MPTKKTTKASKARPATKPQNYTGLESKIAKQLTVADIPFKFEEELPYVKEGKRRRYYPDFMITRGVFIEAKGYFVGGTKDMQKLIIVKDQHPGIDLRLVFQDERKRLNNYPHGTTYADWADHNGFTWAGDGTIPEDWIEDFKKTIH